jgi:hypothetical protein
VVSISGSPPICCQSFSYLDGVAKDYITKLGCEIYFSEGQILSTAGDALTNNVEEKKNSNVT